SAAVADGRDARHIGCRVERATNVCLDVEDQAIGRAGAEERRRARATAWRGRTHVNGHPAAVAGRIDAGTGEIERRLGAERERIGRVAATPESDRRLGSAG